MKTKTKKLTMKDLDVIWSKLIHKKYDNKCAICGATPCQAHHIFSRTYRSTRWDIDNGIALCYRHHFHFAHSKFEEFRDWVIQEIGEELYMQVKERSRQILKESIEDSLERLKSIEI